MQLSPLSQPVLKRHILRNIIIGVILLSTVGGLTYLVFSAIQHTSIVNRVRTELIKQNNIMRAGVKDGIYQATIPVGVRSTDQVKIETAISMSGLLYCMTAISKIDEKIIFHMDTKTPENTPLNGGCSDKATTPPTTPSGVAVASTGTDAITLEWNASPYAAKYSVECATDTLFIRELKVISVSVSSASVTGLISDTAYNCRVAGENNLGKSDWSSIVQADTLPSSSVLSSLKITTISPTELAYSWKPVPEALSYVLEYSTDDNFINNVTIIETLDTSGTVKGFSPDTGYFFHIKVVTSQFPAERATFSPIVQGRTSR